MPFFVVYDLEGARILFRALASEEDPSYQVRLAVFQRSSFFDLQSLAAGKNIRDDISSASGDFLNESRNRGWAWQETLWHFLHIASGNKGSTLWRMTGQKSTLRRALDKFLFL